MKRVLILLVLIAAACRKHETAVPEVIGTPPQMPPMQHTSGMKSESAGKFHAERGRLR
jgi:hypothetical protein